MTPDTSRPRLVTAHGPIRLPAYVPVTTFGAKYPLDDLVRPYLGRLADAVMVSFHYARQMEDRPDLPLLVDSGGFASLFQGAEVREVRGLGVLDIPKSEERETLSPSDVLDLQERHADVAFTLDFPIPPSMARDEAARRVDLTFSNAVWALENRRRHDMLLFASVQGWDVESYGACAARYAGLPFDGFAIGGLVPRVSDRQNLIKIVETVRQVLPDKPLHVFGIGEPRLVQALYKSGVQSVDSSSYVKLAADGRLWGQPTRRLADASPAERLQLAVYNLAMATQTTLPLTTTRALFGSRLWERSEEVA